MKKKYFTYILFLLNIIFVFGCKTTVPEEALKFDIQSLKQRQIQTRIFDTENEKLILSACVSLLQDMGFQIDESETKLGIIVGSKKRSAINAGQVTVSVFFALLTGTAIPVDKEQKIRVCVVTVPFGKKKKRIKIHVTFQRVVWNSQGNITKLEGITEPKIYQEFFIKLSKSLFLEAHQI